MGQFTTEVSIANLALGWLGLDPLVSLDDDSNSAALCKVNLPGCRDFVLEGSDWTFAQKRAVLTPSTAAPAWGYTYAYPLPVDCLRVAYATANPDAGETQQLSQWVVENRMILCNEAALYIRYTARIVDTTRWSEGFSQACAQLLASNIAVAATNSSGNMQLMFQLYQTKKDEAIASDQRQGRRQLIKSNDLKNARGGGWPS